MLEINKPVTAFQLPSTSGKVFSLPEKLGKNLVIYFYPKDNTPGCTTEGENFRDNFDAFESLNCEIVGVSRDSMKSHEKLQSEDEIPF